MFHVLLNIFSLNILFNKVCHFHFLHYHVCLKSVGGMDHVRVHPKFLHSNATSHKWALGGKLVECLLSPHDMI